MARQVDVLQDLREPARALRHAIPGTWACFRDLHHAAMADGGLPTRLEDAAALAVSAVERGDGCIAPHAKAAARAGATPGEGAEMLAVALLLDGGTASVYAPRASDAYDEFRPAAGAGGNGDEAPPAR